MSVFWDENLFERRGIWVNGRSPGRTWWGVPLPSPRFRYADHVSMSAFSHLPEAFFPLQGEIYLPKPISLCRGGVGCKLLRVYF